jgi:hypothetical protein
MASPPAVLILSCSKVAVLFQTAPQGAPGPLRGAIIPIFRVSWEDDSAGKSGRAKITAQAKVKANHFFLSISALLASKSVIR